MTDPDRPSTTDDSEKDQYPPDTEFGRAAANDEERVAELARQGADEDALPEADGRGPRAAGKAEPAGDDDRDERADTASEESFPASDPPSSTGSTAK